MKGKNLVILLFTAMIISLIVIYLSNRYNDMGNMSPGNAVRVKGRVITNDKGCAHDAECILKVDVKGNVVSVFYGGGYTGCGENWKKAQIGFDLKEGDIINIFGKVTDTNLISICPSTEYYIEKLGN